MVKGVPTSVRRRKRQNALLIPVGLLASWALLTAAILAIFTQPVSGSAWAGLGLSPGPLLITLFTVWVYSKARAGPLVLDCGPHPERWFYWMMVVMWLCFTYTNGVMINAYPERLDRWGTITVNLWVVFSILLAIGSAVVAVSRFQVRENGLLLFWWLLKWDRIQSHQWDEDYLLLQAKTRFPALGRTAVAVPGEFRLRLEGFLTEHGVVQNDA